MCVCAIYPCLFIIECCCNMSEADQIRIITDNMKIDEKIENLLSQIEEFEKYLAEMNISVEKRQILLHREDVKPQSVLYNY